MDLTTATNVINAFAHGALLIGPQSWIVGANSAATDLLGADLLGRHYITVLRQPALLDAIEGVMEDNKAREARYLGKGQGEDSTYQVHVRPIGHRADQGVLITFEDISPIESAGKMRRQFVANVSHELRTPLTAMIGFIETLRGPAKSDEAARERFLGIMQREADRMTQLVDDLLSLSRVEDQERRKPRDLVNMNALVQSVILSLAPMTEKASVALDAKLPDHDVLIPADADQIRQVLTNLIENGIKYSGGGKPIEIRLSPVELQPALQREGMCLSVQDFGEGIEGHHIPRLTERFYRIDTHRSREVGGTGLGLAIVKHIVSRHRGRLRVKSKVGEGSVFSVILPSA